jgi:hypothetical protein
VLGFSEIANRGSFVNAIAEQKSEDRGNSNMNVDSMRYINRLIPRSRRRKQPTGIRNSIGSKYSLVPSEI